jgi:hypothetical protein
MKEKLDKIIELVRIIREVQSIEVKDCALDSLIETLEDMRSEAIQKGEL